MSSINIRPSLHPDTLPAGQAVEVLLALTNVNPATTGRLTVEDRFSFILPPALGNKVAIAGPLWVTPGP